MRRVGHLIVAWILLSTGLITVAPASNAVDVICDLEVGDLPTTLQLADVIVVSRGGGHDPRYPSSIIQIGCTPEEYQRLFPEIPVEAEEFLPQSTQGAFAEYLAANPQAAADYQTFLDQGNLPVFAQEALAIELGASANICMGTDCGSMESPCDGDDCDETGCPSQCLIHAACDGGPCGCNPTQPSCQPNPCEDVDCDPGNPCDEIDCDPGNPCEEVDCDPCQVFESGDCLEPCEDCIPPIPCLGSVSVGKCLVGQIPECKSLTPIDIDDVCDGDIGPCTGDDCPPPGWCTKFDWPYCQGDALCDDQAPPTIQEICDNLSPPTPTSYATASSSSPTHIMNIVVADQSDPQYPKGGCKIDATAKAMSVIDSWFGTHTDIWCHDFQSPDKQWRPSAGDEPVNDVAQLHRSCDEHVDSHAPYLVNDDYEFLICWVKKAFNNGYGAQGTALAAEAPAQDWWPNFYDPALAVHEVLHSAGADHFPDYSWRENVCGIWHLHFWGGYWHYHSYRSIMNYCWMGLGWAYISIDDGNKAIVEDTLWP